MVVTRRAPAPPMSASRTNSTHHIPRVKEKGSSTLPNVPGVSSPLANGKTRGDVAYVPDKPEVDEDDSNVSPSKKDPKSKLKHKKGGKKSSKSRTSFTELLSRIFLLWFIIYTVSVCPGDVRHHSALCRGLSEYRHLVIEPYILPPLRLALSHPIVASYVEKVKPYTDHVITTAKPVAIRIWGEWNTRVVPQWNRHIAPQWKKRVIPLWNRLALPQLQRLDARVMPYRTRLREGYEHRVDPIVRKVSLYVGQATYTVSRWQQKTRPYIVLAAHKTYDGYRHASPYARLAWEKLKSLVARFLTLLVRQRRRFVDPHVHKIWESVQELSSGKPRAPAAVDLRDSITSRASRAAEGAASIVSSLMSTSEPSVETTLIASITSSSIDTAEGFASALSHSVHETPSSVSTAMSDSLFSSISTFPASVSPLAGETLSFLSSAATSAMENLPSSASRLRDATSQVHSRPSDAVSFSAEHASAIVSSNTGQVSSSVSSQVDVAYETVPGILAPPSLTTESLSSVVQSSSVMSPQRGRQGDIDLDAFYLELGLDDVMTTETSSSTDVTVPLPVKTQSGEDIERQRARAAKTAEKRDDIMARHTKWDEELAAEIEANKKALRNALVVLRKAAAAELKESAEIRAEVEGLVEDAEKFLRGAEKYLQTLSKENRTDEEKRSMWDRVIGKVDQKFVERLDETEVVVNQWYALVLDKELAEVKKVTEAVRDVADRGQTDIGMDYAYLDDVTYRDWERYHDLLRASDNFTHLAHSIQNGSDPSQPVNSVLTEIADLQAEVQDIVIGFETRLRRIKRNGERALGGGNQDTASEGPDNESVSILPIDNEDKAQIPADINVPPVVIGRSREEVMDALSRAAEDGQAASSPKTVQTAADPESAIGSPAEEDVVGQNDLKQSSLAVHEEL